MGGTCSRQSANKQRIQNFSENRKGKNHVEDDNIKADLKDTETRVRIRVRTSVGMLAMNLLVKERAVIFLIR
jgi:hypothetical protein